MGSVANTKSVKVLMAAAIIRMASLLCLLEPSGALKKGSGLRYLTSVEQTNAAKDSCTVAFGLRIHPEGETPGGVHGYALKYKSPDTSQPENHEEHDPSYDEALSSYISLTENLE